MNFGPDFYAPSAAILAKRWAEGAGLECTHWPSIDSTNTYAKQIAAKLQADFHLVVADHQLKGRGRGSHSWSDDPGRGGQLLSSWIFRGRDRFGHTSAQLVGLALFEALSRCLPQAPLSLKAPNDLYLGEAKVGGLLLEMISGGDSEVFIVGLGLNLFSHPPELAHATDLGAHLAEPASQLPRLFAALYQSFTEASLRAQAKSLSPEVRESLLRALNLYPGLPSAYLEVDALGNLRVPQGWLPWSAL